LADQAATVSVVGSAVDAIKALSTDRPDAVMLDLGRGPRGASRERQVVVCGLVGWATS
jgi:hypothetical protein